MSLSEIVDQVVRIAGRVTAASMADSARETLVNELKRARVPIFTFLLCVVTGATGVVLLVIGAIEALTALHLPSWAIYLGLGAIAVLGGSAHLARKS